MTRVLITGATGFIGTHLTRLLMHNELDVYALVRPGTNIQRLHNDVPALKLVQGDLLLPIDVERCVEEAKPELCFHLAWYVESGKYLTSEKNTDYLTASIYLARQLAATGCQRLVVTGTCFEYDTNLGYLSEQSATMPRHLYSACKLSLYLVLEQLSLQTGLGVTWARLFYQYGPGEDSCRLVPSVVLALLKNQPVALTLGQQVRDYLHVEDVASALWAVGQHRLSGAVNIGSGVPVTVRNLAEITGMLIGKPELLEFGAIEYASNDPMFVCANNHRLVTEAGWTPSWNLESGLKHTIEWFRQNYDAR